MDNEKKETTEKFGEMKISGGEGVVMQPETSVSFRSPMPQFGGGVNEPKKEETFKMPMPMPEFGEKTVEKNELKGDDSAEMANFGLKQTGKNQSGVGVGGEAENGVKEDFSGQKNEEGPVFLGQKKSNKKTIIAAVIAVFVICGSATAWWMIFGRKQDNTAVKPAENTEKKEQKNEDIKIPETDEEVLTAAKESLAKDEITAENLKIEKKEKNLVMVSYAGGVAIIEVDGITNPILTKGKSLTDYEGLYGGGKVPAEFLHGKFEDRALDALAREQKKSFEAVKKENEITLVSMDGKKSEFVQISVREKVGGGYVAFLKENEKDGRYEWVAGGQAITEENMKALKEKGFPEKYWKKSLEDLEKSKKAEEENSAKKKEEEDKKKKEEQEKAKNSEEAFKEKIYKGLAEYYKEPLEKIKKEHSISLLANDNDGRFINVRYGNCNEEKDNSCGYNSVKMLFNTATGQYVFIASSKPLKIEEVKKLKDLGFPEKYWKEDLEKLQKGN